MRNFYYSCTIITTAANALINPIHQRMPVIIENKNYNRWLDKQATLETRQSLLAVDAYQGMMRKPISAWVNSPHHILISTEDMINYHVGAGLDAHITHYEKDDLRDRHRIERKWARAVSRRKTLGLSADIYEVDIQPEVHKYTNPEEWK